MSSSKCINIYINFLIFEIEKKITVSVKSPYNAYFGFSIELKSRTTTINCDTGVLEKI